ncbi:MAG: hypothetical protein FWC06_01005 [Treponema sp.]|nr:hypothetical protein [Treponema sp.]
MKKLFFFIFLLGFSFVFVSTQNVDLIDIDFDSIDSIFGEPSAETPAQEETPKTETVSVVQSLRRRGLEFDFSYAFRGTVNPGWVDYYPWEQNSSGNFTWAPAIKMSSAIGINARISDAFRVQSVINFAIPGTFPYISLGNFFFDYNFLDKVFLRAGKAEQKWGISTNFSFTNLLSRIPDNGPSGPSYLIRLDVPVGVGGLQLLAQTRSDIAAGKNLSIDSIGFGGKYNLALQWADFNFGAFYQKEMATRAFLSVKTTLWDFEVYNEWLAAFNTHTDKEVSFAFNLGFLRSFINNKLDVNAEFFYNREGRSLLFKPETDYELIGTTPFLGGINAAVNLLYRFDGWGNLRLFTRFLYGDDSFSIVPGIRITPFQNLEIYFALPMAFGNGYYKTAFKDARNDIKPFSIMLYVTLSGNVRASYYY